MKREGAAAPKKPKKIKNHIRLDQSAKACAVRRKLFVEAMCRNGWNQTKAAVEAGFKPGYAAEHAGWRLSREREVAQAIADRRKEMLDIAQAKTQLTADEILESLARDLRFDPATLYDEHGALKPIHEIETESRMVLRGIEVEELFRRVKGKRVKAGQTVKIKFPERTAAREQGMKHFGLYEKDNAQQPGLSIEVGFVKPRV